MLTKAQLQDLLVAEMRIVRHLATKVPPGTLDWRPSPGQRSTIELLRYLSTATIDLTREVLSGGFDAARVTGKAPKDLSFEAFDEAMARQEAAVLAALAPLSDADLTSRPATLPTGQATNLGAALVTIVLRCLIAYRMQLFLHAKASGAAALTTWNCWYGVDAPA